MPKGTCSIARIDGLKTSSRRAIVFLIRNRGLNGKSAFDKLSSARDIEVRNRFDHWIDGNTCDKYFHGWRDPNYRHCFCFRWKEKRVHQRFYGFTSNPKPDDKRFELCILVSHTAKTTEDTDLTILDEINRLRSDPDVTAAIQRYLEGK